VGSILPCNSELVIVIPLCRSVAVAQHRIATPARAILKPIMNKYVYICSTALVSRSSNAAVS
jgi:hypothetical protein